MSLAIIGLDSLGPTLGGECVNVYFTRRRHSGFRECALVAAACYSYQYMVTI